MTNVAEDLKDWQDLTLDQFDGGLVLEGDTELLEVNELLEAKNMVYKDEKFKRDTGYKKLYEAVVGDPRRHVTYRKRDGAVVEFLITNASAFRSDSGHWRPVLRGTAPTTVNGNEAAGQTVITVVNAAGFGSGNRIGIELDDGTWHMTTVNGAPAGNDITITVALPSQASNGNDVIRMVSLSGDTSHHVTAVPVPWGDYVVFTNGVDVLKYYDPATDTVADVAGVPTNMVCQTLALFDNSIVVAATIESGVNLPYRVRWCAKGDLANWTTLESGFTDLLDTESHIKQLLKLGPFLMIYREKSISRMAISGALFRRFDFDTAVNDVGVFSQYSVIDLVDYHIVWANDDIYRYAGGSAVESLESPIYQALFGPDGEMGEDTRSKAFAVYLRKTKEALFIYQPTGAGGCTSAARYNLRKDNWTTRVFADNLTGFGSRVSNDALDWEDLVGDWVDQTNPWSSYSTSGNVEQQSFGTTSDRVMIYDYLSGLDNTSGIICSIQTKDFSHPSYLTRHDYLDVFAAGGTITVEYSTDKGASWEMLGTISASTVSTRYRLFKQFTARHLRFRLTSSSSMTLAALHMRFKYEFEH